MQHTPFTYPLAGSFIFAAYVRRFSPYVGQERPWGRDCPVPLIVRQTLQRNDLKMIGVRQAGVQWAEPDPSRCGESLPSVTTDELEMTCSLDFERSASSVRLLRLPPCAAVRSPAGPDSQMVCRIEWSTGVLRRWNHSGPGPLPHPSTYVA